MCVGGHSNAHNLFFSSYEDVDPIISEIPEDGI